jgi:protein-S-isoprenylcysteine O-methyltransferase Ste14
MDALIFTSNYLYMLVFYAVLLVYFVGEFIGATIVLMRKRKGAAIAERNNMNSHSVLIVAWIVVFYTSYLTSSDGLLLLPSWVYYLGLGFVVFGLVFRQYAIAVLGRYFSTTIGIQESQKIVQAGPYRWIRHPSYSAILFVYLGIALAFQSPVAAVASVLIFAVAFGHRISIEENILTQQFGAEYTEYKKRTKRLIPFLI